MSDSKDIGEIYEEDKNTSYPHPKRPKPTLDQLDKVTLNWEGVNRKDKIRRSRDSDSEM